MLAVMLPYALLHSVLRRHGDVDLLQGGGLVASAAQSAPTGHGGQHSCVCGSGVRWQTGGGDLVGEGDCLREAEDGVVVVRCSAVVVRVVDDLSNINPVEHAVRDVVLSEENSDVGGGGAVGAVGGGAHVPAHQSHLPWVFVLLSLLTTNNTAVGSATLHSALAGSRSSSHNWSWSRCGDRSGRSGGNRLLNRAGGVAVSPGADSSNVVVVGVSLSRAPGPGVPVDGGATKVGGAHEVERERASGSGRWPVVGQAGGPRSGGRARARSGC